MFVIYGIVMFVPFTTLSGNDERPNMATPVVLSTSATTTMQKIFIGMPVNTYSARKGVKYNKDKLATAVSMCMALL